MKSHLANLGQHLRSRAPKPGHATNPMRGSNKLPAFANPERQPRVVVVQRGPAFTHDPRFQCAPDERPDGYGASKSPPGINPLTGLEWGKR